MNIELKTDNKINLDHLLQTLRNSGYEVSAKGFHQLIVRNAAPKNRIENK